MNIAPTLSRCASSLPPEGANFAWGGPAQNSPASVDAQRAQAVAEAMAWLGTPYHHHARIKGVGVDCAQLLCGVFEACGLVPAIDTGHYPADWHLHHSDEIFSAWLGRHAHQRPTGAAMLPGDVLLFKFGRTYSHGSIVVQTGAHGVVVVHSYIGRGVHLSRLTEEPLAGRPMQHWSVWPGVQIGAEAMS